MVSYIRFLYALFLALDANFRLRRKDVSSEAKDPGLSKGYAFYCEVVQYMEHVKTHWRQTQDRSQCVAHDAVDKPDREARGTASSGVCTVDCARHNMKRTNGVGDLQLGERYMNMDYMFFKSIAGSDLQCFFISYDIACQWSIKLWQRMEEYSPTLHFEHGSRYVRFLVPKFHLPAHIEECNVHYLFNLMRGVGETDGEAPERGWSDTNGLSGATMNSGPGTRRDRLNDFWNDANFKKIVKLGTSLRDKMLNALPLMIEAAKAFVDLEKSFDSSTLATWLVMARRWEDDPKAPNPFQSAKRDKHLAQVRRELAEEAEEREAAGIEESNMVRADMHVTEFLVLGLQLEEQQRQLEHDMRAVGRHPTDKQRAAMTERSSKLRRKIVTWTEIQSLFFPNVNRLREMEDKARAKAAESQTVPGLKVYELKLWLPSQLVAFPGAWIPVDSSANILNAEYRLRVGQANEALDEIRKNLIVRTHLYSVKDRHKEGVRAHTRAMGKIAVVNERIRRLAEKYRAAWSALGRLGPVLGHMEWRSTLLALESDDLRPLPKNHFGDVTRQRATQSRNKKKSKSSQSKPAAVPVPRKPSWIWTTALSGSMATGSLGANEALRIEWAKTRAKAMRWREEVDLLEEEMRRVTQFMEWRAKWWTDQVGQRELEPGAQLEGETAYALRQADLQRRLLSSFQLLWSKANLQSKIAEARKEMMQGESDQASGDHEGGGDSTGADNEYDAESDEDESEGSEDEAVTLSTATSLVLADD
ncbi:unnamed protein product [Mycena citricolor]|uniref:CxC1-like cysteine cluster associated with KDZ transposases domain-containing protein n=1 Tax=Mycena citricolor TaxID=2018698 RepID=A0AAD2H0Y6_9AGAR|nr:unnamed protein product [Mycena citricolor]